MGLFYEVTQKELLEARNKIFLEKGLPVLQQHRFRRSPFDGALFGRNNLKDFTYKVCRLNERSHLEILTVHISKGDSWIKPFLNIFELKPAPKGLDELNGIDGCQFGLPPNSRSDLRIGGLGLEKTSLLPKVKYKIKPYFSKSGFQRRLLELGDVIERDLDNIDFYVSKWHEMYNMITTDWKGKAIE